MTFDLQSRSLIQNIRPPLMYSNIFFPDTFGQLKSNSDKLTPKYDIRSGRMTKLDSVFGHKFFKMLKLWKQRAFYLNSWYKTLGMNCSNDDNRLVMI